MSKEEIIGIEPADAIRQILEKENLNQQRLAEKMGITRQNVSQMLNRNVVSMRYDSFYKMVKTLGYEVFIRKK